jgi:sugar-specific transcriptional regulator TrmB
MNTQTLLQQLGLTQSEAIVYEYLLNTGPSIAKNILSHTNMSKATLYLALENLIKKKLLEEVPDMKVGVFRTTSPRKLDLLVSELQRNVDRTRYSFTEALPQYISLFMMASQKPFIEFYEGFEGIQKVAFDIFTCPTEVLSFTDNESVDKYYPELNKAYAKKRVAKKIHKRILYTKGSATDTAPNPFTEKRYLDRDFRFATVVQIYDGKVSYITLDPNRKIGVIIKDPHIYATQKALFECLWEGASRDNLEYNEASSGHAANSSSFPAETPLVLDESPSSEDTPEAGLSME